MQQNNKFEITKQNIAIQINQQSGKINVVILTSSSMGDSGDGGGRMAEGRGERMGEEVEGWLEDRGLERNGWENGMPTNYQRKVQKFVKLGVDLIGESRFFQNLRDIYDFLINQENYCWNKDKMELELFFKIVGVNYMRENSIKIKLQQVTLNQIQIIENENRWLKRQLDYYKNKANQVPSIPFYHKNNHRQSIQSFSAFRQPILPHIQAQFQTQINTHILRQDLIRKQSRSQSQSQNESQDISQRMSQKSMESEKQHRKIRSKRSLSSTKADKRQRLNKSTVKMPKLQKFQKLQKLQKSQKPQMPILMKDRIDYLLKTNQKQKQQFAKLQQQKQLKKLKQLKRLKKQLNIPTQPKQKKIRKSPKSPKSSPKSPKPRKIRKIPKISPKLLSPKPKLKLQKIIKRQEFLDKARKDDDGSEFGRNIQEVTLPNGDLYRGEMRYKKFHGRGVYFGKNYRFQGIWRNGYINGAGVCYSANGNVSKGIYNRCRKRFGQGQDKYQNGQSYLGQFQNQKKHGQGTYTFHNNDYYQGSWKNDMQHGRGVEYYHSSNTRFEGTWRNDEKDGEGLLISSQGKIRQVWEKGTLKSEYVLVDD